MAKTETLYKGRGIHNEKLYNSLKSGNLRDMLSTIKELGDLDVQIRNNYLNIYYKGGNIAKVNSEKSVEFDEKYYKLKEVDTDGKEEKRILINQFKRHDYKGYFEVAKGIMDKWFKEHPNPERDEQHKMAIENKYLVSDYTIIDLEYQVSIQSEFYCTFTALGKNKPKNPRFDIIAVNKRGQLVIIELKKGVNALKGISGLQEHLDCYNVSIGRNCEPFMQEMSELLKQKQQFRLIDKAVKITDPRPVFMFAYAYNDLLPDKEQEAIFTDAYNKIRADISVPIIWLKRGSHKLLDI